MPRLTPALLTTLVLALAGCPSKEECSAGKTSCSGTCHDTQSDPFACGTCGHICPQGASCLAGQCQCPSRQVPCGTKCVDLQADAQNCGACGKRCTLPPPAPVLGTCNAGVCDCAGASSCPALDPECRDTQTDPTACGDCLTSCPLAGDVCDAGGCTCPALKPDACIAQGLCTNLDTDPAHCGACDQPCPLASAVCAAGACGCPAAKPTACMPPQVPAPGACVDTQTDEASCGSCGTPCATGATCTGGTCSCPGTAPDVCAGTCVDKQTSTAHCGACNAPCAAGQVCKAGVCCVTCPGGACQTEHSNGVGGKYRDCNPLGTYTQVSAQAAASSWSATGTLYLFPALVCPLSSACLGWQTTNACGVWCWGVSDADSLRGRMTLNTASNTCVCPSLTSPTWN